jgi:hypothetical protein
VCGEVQQWSTVRKQNGDELLRKQYLRFEVVMMVNMKITVYWDVMSCSLVDVHQCLKGMLHHQVRWCRQQVSLKCQIHVFCFYHCLLSWKLCSAC